MNYIFLKNVRQECARTLLILRGFPMMDTHNEYKNSLAVLGLLKPGVKNMYSEA